MNRSRNDYSPVNHSTSKQNYSFPKAIRFEKKPVQSLGGLYNIPSKLDKRGTSIGYGNRYDFTKHINNSAPFYNYQSDFDPKTPHSPKWTFGISREHFEKVYIEGKINPDKSNPGPGNYTWAKPLGSEAPKISMTFRHKKHDSSLNRNPGPGNYNSISMNMGGKYPISHFRNATSIIFGCSKDTRFKYKKEASPGPSDYEKKPLINGTGINFLSQFRSYPSKTVNGKPKYIVKNEKVPGPGSYNIFTEFGGTDEYRPKHLITDVLNSSIREKDRINNTTTNMDNNTNNTNNDINDNNENENNDTTTLA